MSVADKVTIDGVEYVKASGQPAKRPDGLQYSVVRCRNAGVHAGYVEKLEDGDLMLYESRRLWRWHGRTLSGLATEGTDDPRACKFGDELPELRLNAIDWCEIIPCTRQSEDSLRSVEAWVND